MIVVRLDDEEYVRQHNDNDDQDHHQHSQQSRTRTGRTMASDDRSLGIECLQGDSSSSHDSSEYYDECTNELKSRIGGRIVFRTKGTVALGARGCSGSSRRVDSR